MTAETYHDTVYELGLLNVRVILWRSRLWWKRGAFRPFVHSDDRGFRSRVYRTVGIGSLWLQWWSE